MQMLAKYLEILGYRVVNVGCFGTDKVDYPDIAQAVCRKVVSGECERGIVLDGAGIGSCMAADESSFINGEVLNINGGYYMD
jgi:ribose 5-phosphate isomerase B